MIETERLETYLLTHAKCATREARSAFTRHLIVFITAVVLFTAHALIWDPALFPMSLVPLALWAVAVQSHYRHGVRRVERELDACIEELVEHFEDSIPQDTGWRPTALSPALK